jgi:hypothetical protein
MPAKTKRSRTVGIRVTPDQYAWLANEARRQTSQLGFKVTMSAIATKLLTQAMANA